MALHSGCGLPKAVYGYVGHPSSQENVKKLYIYNKESKSYCKLKLHALLYEYCIYLSIIFPLIAS